MLPLIRVPHALQVSIFQELVSYAYRFVLIEQTGNGFCLQAVRVIGFCHGYL